MLLTMRPSVICSSTGDLLQLIISPKTFATTPTGEMYGIRTASGALALMLIVEGRPAGTPQAAKLSSENSWEPDHPKFLWRQHPMLKPMQQPTARAGDVRRPETSAWTVIA